MKRWIFAAAAALLALAATAQESVVRVPPPDVKPARMVVTAPPEITINGKPDRLSPGARIRDVRNLGVLSASLAGQDLPVLFRREPMGMVHEVWLLTPDEYAKVTGLRDPDSPNGQQRLTELLETLWKARALLPLFR